MITSANNITKTKAEIRAKLNFLASRARNGRGLSIIFGLPANSTSGACSRIKWPKKQRLRDKSKCQIRVTTFNKDFNRPESGQENC